MKTIGFGGTFYTLWDVSADVKYTDANHRQLITNYCYYKNLSMDLNSAKAKVIAEFGPDTKYQVDLSVKGQKTYSYYGPVEECYPDDTFPVGRAAGQKIAESDDVYHLELQANIGRTQLRKDLAYARLVELNLWGEFNGERMNLDSIEEFKFNASLPVQILGLHHNEGDKVELTVMLIGSFSFDGAYGTCYVQTFQSVDGCVYKYMGSSPQDIAVKERVTVKATIKHSSYNGNAETKLNRIKVTKRLTASVNA